MHSDEVMQSCPLLCVPACECGRLHTSDRMQLNFYLHMHVSVIQELHVEMCRCNDSPPSSHFSGGLAFLTSRGSNHVVDFVLWL